jgi:glycosyltransferase involved in cell wall biosynthesis
MSKRVLIYVPAYNAASQIEKTLNRIPESIRAAAREILVVNNASTDETAKIVDSIQQKGGIPNLKLITNAKNLGYGGSQKVAYQRAIDENYDVVAMVHADGQYAPEILPKMLEPVVRGETDLLFGSRIKGNPLKGGMPVIRYLGNRVLTTFQNIFLGLSISEYHSGYRIYSVEAFRKIPFQNLSNDYHFDTEILICFQAFGLRIKEIAIPTHYGDEPNFVNIWKYGLDVLITTMSYFLHRIGLRRSRNWTRIFDGKNPWEV